ncbi:cytochrome P450 [Actinokineospora enzanensis]|uniref:cytochrome P450 n=1 Tax=Actinokineospora enzanensis TaxID=155975 RepID=UPI0003616AE3|nr:cytochrome P450 [Actinokineospora enzanensis]
MTAARETYDAVGIAALEDPYPAYRELRAAGPVVPAGPGTWAVTRHAEVSALLTDPRLGHEFPDLVYRASGQPEEVTDFFRATVLNRDAPVHTALRRAMGRLLSPRAMATLRERIDRLVGELFARMAEHPTADIVADLAYPLPVTVASELLGIPAADRDMVRPYAVALSRSFGTGVRAEGDLSAAAAAVRWLRDYVRALLEDRTGRAGDPLEGVLATADAGLGITADDLVDNVIFLFFAGFDTTTNLIGTGCATLLRRPDQLALLRARPELAGSAAEEFLRHDAPIQATARVATAPLAVGGRTIRPNRLVVLLLGSANHDERRFAEPERVDITRSPNPHLGFSAGPHFCLGAALARIEAASVFTHVAAAARFESAGAPTRREHTSFRGFETVPVAIGRPGCSTGNAG